MRSNSTFQWGFLLLNKEDLRHAFRRQRKKISCAERQVASEQAATLLLEQELFQTSLQIACYLAQDNEFDSTAIIKTIWYQKKNCYLPVLSTKQKKQLEFMSYLPSSKMLPNCYNILEPVNTSSISPQQLDMVLMPLVAFDLKGNRLGMGGGYYDRTFAFLKNTSDPKPILIGLAYADQCYNQLPEDAWDIPLRGVLTEKEFIYFNKKVR